MSSLYWEQWDAADLKSWQGVDLTDHIHENDEDFDIENKKVEEEGILSPYDIDMLTWRDFL